MYQTKVYPNTVEIKVLVTLRQFIVIEISNSHKGVYAYQHKCVFSLLEEKSCVSAKTINFSLELNWELKKCGGGLVENIQSFQKLAGKLIYLIVTQPDISYIVSLINQFMHKPMSIHVEVAHKILRYLKETLGHGINMKN